MEPLVTFSVGSLKVLVLLVVATGLTTALRGHSARLRVVVWSTALAGSLLIPVVAPILPPLALPLPEVLSRFDPPGSSRSPSPEGLPTAMALADGAGGSRPVVTITDSELDQSTLIHPPWLAIAWALGALAALSHLAVGWWRMERTIRRARPVAKPDWHVDLAWAIERVGCRRQVRLLSSTEVDIPATVGLFRPVVLVPSIATTWDRERREAVLLHELIHVSRLDWPLRIVARLARSAYWFNPLAWWAVRRLDLEQELACDEEVVAFGARPSSYACQLLGIARAVGRSPLAAAHGLHLIRRSHLEARIMTILKNTHHRRAGLAVLAPAAILIAALVPALAAMAPADPTPASPEIKQILNDMKEAEALVEPHIERMREVELEMVPRIEALEHLEIEIDHEDIEAIHDQIEPHLERLAQIEIEMEPHIARLEEFERQMQNLELHIEDGTLEDIERQIHDQLGDVHEQMERIQLELQPFHERMESIHRELEPLHRELERIHVEIEPRRADLEHIHESMEPLHERMEEIHREMEPFHEEMERLGERLHEALRTEVAGSLHRQLGAVTGPDSPFTEAAARILEAARINTTDTYIRVSASPDETRQILVDLFGPNRIGTQQSFDAAVDAAINSLSPLVLTID